MDKEDVTYIYTHTHEYYSAMRKKEILSFMTTGVNLEGITLSEISQTEKDKYCMILLICGIKAKQKTSEKQNRVVVPGAGGWEK